MRPKAHRWLVGTVLATVMTSVLTIFAPAPAHAQDCYTVWVGSQPTQICPWQ